jgi:hypothetical protein
MAPPAADLNQGPAVRNGAPFFTSLSLVFSHGSEIHDVLYGPPPFHAPGRAHVKLRLGNSIATSILLICRKFG